MINHPFLWHLSLQHRKRDIREAIEIGRGGKEKGK